MSRDEFNPFSMRREQEEGTPLRVFGGVTDEDFDEDDKIFTTNNDLLIGNDDSVDFEALKLEAQEIDNKQKLKKL